MRRAAPTGLAACLLLAAPAGATFPGRNGLVAFASDGRVHTMTLAGTRLRTVLEGERPAWAPGGRSLAFVRTPSGNTDVFTVRSDGTGVRRLTHHAGEDEDPAWSPDGRQLVFARRSGQGVGLAVMNASRGPARMLVRGGFSGGPAWSPDGRRIAFHRDRGFGPEIWIVRSDGTGLRQLTRLRRPPSLACEQDRWPDWSPDGRTVVFGRLFGDACEQSRLFTIRPDGSGLRRLGAPNLVYEAPRYSPDGRSVVAVGAGGASLVVLTSRGQLMRSIPVDGGAGPPSWQPLGGR